MKRKNHWKLLIRIIGALLGAVLAVMPVFGITKIEVDRECSLTIHAVHDKTVLPGIRFSLYRVADVDAAGKFTLSGAFSSCGEEINGLSDAREWKEKAKALETWAITNQIEPMITATADQDGAASFSKLRTGLYLTGSSRVTISEKEYKSDAFLIALPNLAVNQESWIYGVTAEAKTEAGEVPTVPPTSEPATEPTSPSSEPATEPTSPTSPSAEEPTRHPHDDRDSDDARETEREMESEIARETSEAETESVQETIRTTPGPEQGKQEDAARLPQTGQLKWPVPVLMVCGLILMTGMFFAKRKGFRRAAGAAGMLCLAGALSLQCFNSLEERRSDRIAADTVAKLEQTIGEPGAAVQRDDAGNNAADRPDGDSQTDDGIEVNSEEYLGYLTIPGLELSLPVMEDWSYPKLRKSPCRYSGSAAEGGFVIAAHNYKRHFYGISSLRPGDPVLFTDVSGTVHRYQVARTELLEPEAVEEMKDRFWDLTLFTCTYGGKHRITVRCVEEQEHDRTADIGRKN